MFWRALILGLVVGLGLGWLLFHDPASGSGNAELEALRDGALIPPPALHGAGPTSERATPSPESDAVEEARFVALVETGRPEAIRAALESAARPLPDVAVAVAATRLDAARADGNWELFRAMLRVLGHADTAEADARLVSVLGDESLVFKHFLGHDFHDWLENSEAPGIAAAARTRLNKNVADGDTSWQATHGWVNLVADHGSKTDIEWLVTRPDEWDVRDDGALALAASTNPRAIEWMREALGLSNQERGTKAGHGSYGKALDTFVKSQGADAFDLVSEILERRLADDSVGGNADTRKLFRHYGRTVPEARATEAARLLLGLSTERSQAAAVNAVVVMRSRGLDVSGLEIVLDAPIRALYRIAQGGEPSSKGDLSPSAAMYAVEYNPGIWSEEAARALEAAADALDAAAAASKGAPGDPGMRKVATEVRAALRSPWRPQ